MEVRLGFRLGIKVSGMGIEGGLDVELQLGVQILEGLDPIGYWHIVLGYPWDRHGELGVVTQIREERRGLGCRVRSVVVSELGHGK